jgi:hypothetical protein
MKASWFRLEIIAVGTIAVFSALFLLQTYDYGRRAALFPRLISVTILFLTAVFIVSRLGRGLKRAAATQRENLRPEVGSETRAGGISWLLALAAASGFSALIYLIGFGFATFAYVATHLYLAGYRRHIVVFFFARAMAAVMVFTGYLFNIQLPRGVLVEMIHPTS